MFKCHVCGSADCHTEYVSEVFNRETTERIRVMLHGKDKPVRSISLDVFSYS